MQVAIVSPYAPRLARLIEPSLPSGVTLHGFSGEGAPGPEILNAEVALGAPDLMVALLAHMPRLRWVQSTWAGITPFMEHPRRDYHLTGVKGLFGVSMAEYVLGWSLAIRRSILAHAAARHWEFRPDDGLSGLRLGVAGVGSIGAEVAVRCAPFFAEVRGLNRDGHGVAGCDACFAMADRLAFARDVDVLALVLPQTAETSGFADQELMEALSPGAMLINAGRANALDLPAALAALEGGGLSALVLDVLDEEPLPDGDPLWNTPGVYISSHTAAPTRPETIAQLFLDNLARYRAMEPLQGLIDFERGY